MQMLQGTGVGAGAGWKWVRASLICGMVAAVFWSVADMLLVGFVPGVQAHQSFAQALKALESPVDVDLALLMLDAQPWRLFWGVYLATFSVLFYVLAVYGIYRLLPSGVLSLSAALALLAGYVTSPVGHAGFAYVGLLAQSMQHAQGDTLVGQALVLGQFEHLLNVHWLVSVSASALGWLLVLVQVLSGRAVLPRWMVLLNPILLAPVIGWICQQFEGHLFAHLIGCACLNISQLLFFVAALVMFRKGTEATTSGYAMR